MFIVASTIFNTYIDWTNMAKTIKAGDKEWTFTEGLVMFRRAAIEIDENCPDMYKHILMQCVDKGWLKPVAYLPQEEEFLQTLSGVIPK